MATKIKPNQAYICWHSFAGNQGLCVREGDRLLGENPIVQRFPERFIADGASTDEINRLKAQAAAPPPPPLPLGPTRLRVLWGQGGKTALEGGTPQRVISGGREFTSGDVFEAEGPDAQFLLDAGTVELVKGPARKSKGRATKPKTPTTVPTTGITTGREEA